MFDAGRLCMHCMQEVIYNNFCGSCGNPPLHKQIVPNALPLRTILNGRYLTGKVLGAGGFGITYLGYDLQANKRIAIKEFMPSGLAKRTAGQTMMQSIQEGKAFSESKQRFLEEARTIYQYRQNPNILQVYSLFEENGTAYYAMEFLEGMDLKHLLLERGGKVSWQELKPIVLQVIDALQPLHNNGVVHRDISPDNIYISPYGKVTLIDFGASRQFVAQKQMTVILKRKYAPIEQYEMKGKQGPWTDIYALAATIYHALTGCLPPEATQRAYRDEIKSFRQCGILLDINVEQAIYKALKVEKEYRYQNVVAFRNNLLGLERKIMLTCLKGNFKGMQLELNSDITVGRNPEICQLVYPKGGRGISKRHCMFSVNRGGTDITVIDMGSTYGTWVNGVRLLAGVSTKLSFGDTVTFGEEEVWQITD